MQVADYNLLYNSLSFAIATFGASTVFFFCQRSQVAPAYKTSLTLAGLVCLIALYHYLRIFESFNDAYIFQDGLVEETGGQLNVSYRYVGWLLTVPLLLLELVLVIRLSREETFSVGTKLTVAAIIMVLLGYSGEVLVDTNQIQERWIYWSLAMLPFLYILYYLIIKLKNPILKQPKNVRSLVSNARWLLILSWAIYPVVYLLPIFDPTTSYINLQVGYTLADILSLALFGVMIYLIAQRKSDIGA
jgi:bacteriorhodopsin